MSLIREVRTPALRPPIAVAIALAVLIGAACLPLAACSTDDAIQAATGETPMQFVERQCMEQHVVCARVYAFPQVADNPLGRVEMCVRLEDLALAESIYGGPAELSPDARFDQWRLLGVEPVCWWQCPSARGCNAFGGGAGMGSCFCPEVTP